MRNSKVLLKGIICACVIILLAAVALLTYNRSHRETEYTITQAIIEHIAGYQEEIEGWGYQVSVLSDMTEEPDYECLMRYYWKHAGPVLILTDADGGMYCFYYGFDQYASEITYPETVLTFYPEKEYVYALKIVRLQIYKNDINRAPLFENTADPDSQSYYDMEVRLYTDFVSSESGEELYVSIDDAVHGYFRTRYCSNNFVDCNWYVGIDPASANQYADRNIKEAYSAGELLAHYQQGLELQNRLITLYHERQGG